MQKRNEDWCHHGSTAHTSHTNQQTDDKTNDDNREHTVKNSTEFHALTALLLFTIIAKLVTIQRESSSVGRASPCHGEGRGVEPRFSLRICHLLNTAQTIFDTAAHWDSV